MATNFPASQDNFTNPTSGSSLSSPSHSQQHSDVNDAVEAIEGALLDGAPLHIDDANERVGIGTTSPAVQLQLAGTDDREALRLSGDGGSSGNQGSVFMGFHHWATGTHPSARIGVIETDNADYDASLVFQTRSSDADVVPSTRMTINESGNVGINDSTPSYQLDVNGSEDTASRININSANTANRYLMRFSRNNVLLANGVYADTGTAYFGTPSDVNLKTGIESISTSDALTALNALRAVDYRYLLDTDDVVRKGFIAQEVEEVIPEAVKRVGGGHPTTQLVFDENGDLQAESVDENGDPLVQEEPDIILNWEPITTTLVAAVQELSSLATTLVARIEALEAG